MDERIYGLLGRKLGHSWSVPIHAALGNGAYRLLELEPDGLAPFLHRKDIGGLNVTIPYKRDVMPLCDEIDRRRRPSAASTPSSGAQTASWWAIIRTSTGSSIWPAGRVSPCQGKSRDFGQRRGRL